MLIAVVEWKWLIKRISETDVHQVQSASAQLAHRLENHRSAGRLQSVALSVGKFALHALRREAEPQPLPCLLFADSLKLR
jgi:hypothetical protein